MPLLRAQRTQLGELAWLSDISEARQPLSEIFPIWVRHGTIVSGPAAAHPEFHPYCEFGTNFEGEVDALVGGEKARRLPGDLFLAGPMMPHWARIIRYPLRFVTIYFLPSALIELGPESDGPQILCRFTASHSLRDCLVRLPPPVRQQFLNGFEQIIAEFESEQFGREITLRTQATEMLVQLMRWEQKNGRTFGKADAINWRFISKALQYLREHFCEPVYAREVARAAGISESQLRILFKQALRISWSKYLQAYRIHLATQLLSQTNRSVLDVALEVGFGSLSHFHAAFRSITGLTPSDYGKQTSPIEPLHQPSPRKAVGTR